MTAPRESLYEALGVASDARPGEIARAYERLVADFALDTTPPDPRREARIREAFQVLADEARRAEYDRSLAAGGAPARADGRTRLAATVGVAAALVVALAWYFSGPGEAPGNPGRPSSEIQAEIGGSVGRVRAIDLSGRAAETGFAFTVAEGVMATTCDGLAPGAQIVVTIGSRAVPARIAEADESLGLCKLAVEGAGSWPMPLAGGGPGVGERVYAAGLGASGDVVLAEGVVKRVATEGALRIVEAAVPGVPAMGGRPLLDAQGRVVGVASAAQPGGSARYVMVPAGWATEQPSVQAPAPTPAPAPVGESPPASPMPARGSPEDIARKLRPPPTVPDDL